MTEPEQSHDDQLDALFAQVRARRADTAAAEYAFETRLMARLREKRAPGTVWAMVSWRLSPFLAAGVVALAFWQMELTDETHEAATFASFENPASTDLWNALD